MQMTSYNTIIGSLGLVDKKPEDKKPAAVAKALAPAKPAIVPPKPVEKAEAKPVEKAVAKPAEDKGSKPVEKTAGHSKWTSKHLPDM